MTNPAPDSPKIYHIVHVNRLPSIIAEGHLLCDAEVNRQESPGTNIGMAGIKRRRLEELTLTSHPELHVGDCVPFYFCPRSIMLYIIQRANHPELAYRGGQGPIIHLVADLFEAVAWADQNKKRWAFTLSNAGSYYFEDRCDLAQLNEIDWGAVHAEQWSGPGIPSSVKEGKQAEFLVEEAFPWHLVSQIAVHSPAINRQVSIAMQRSSHRPPVRVIPGWYY